MAILVFQFLFFTFLVILSHFILLAIKWFISHFIRLENFLGIADLRKNIFAKGKEITFCLMKAKPKKGVWFGHLWIIWPEETLDCVPSGLYPFCKKSAIKSLLLSLLSPFCLLHGQKPIKGVFLDDSQTECDASFSVIIDIETYEKALASDKVWRENQSYKVLPGLFSKSQTCRDHVFEVASEIGLSAERNLWASFPAESFHILFKQNRRHFEKIAAEQRLCVELA